MKRGRDRLLGQLRPRIEDERVLQAIAAVPRDRFVPPRLRRDAWENVPLPIGSEQTISQPLVVARMCELLALHGDSGARTVLDRPRTVVLALDTADGAVLEDFDTPDALSCFRAGTRSAGRTG